MSTSLMVTKMKESAEKRNIEVSIDAFPEAQMEKHVDEANVILWDHRLGMLLRGRKGFASREIFQLQ